MKVALLLALGMCIGALGAWQFRGDAATSAVVPDAGRELSRSGSSVVPDRGFGDSDAGIDDSNGVAATPESLRTRAETAPRDAFSDALLLRNGGQRTRALMQVTRTWARSAPGDALEQALGLPGDLRMLVASAAAQEWAFVDPSGFLDYARAAVSLEPILAGLTALLATDPDTVWEIANGHAGPVGSVADELALAAVRAIAGRDPAAAIARFQALATGQRRDAILARIAEGYTDRDPEAALNWVLSLQPLSTEAATVVIERIAVEDPLRAYEVVRRSGGPGLRLDSLRWMLATAALQSRQDPASIATALVERYEPEFSDPLVSVLLSGWVEQAPDNAMAWLSANRANLSPESITVMASGLAFDDVRLAASLLDQVPPEFQFEWLQETAKRYGQFEPEVAVEWLAQFAARPDYDQLMSQMVLFGDSRFAAALVESSGSEIDGSAINLAANIYARQDPRSAADWALGLKDPDRSAAAIYGVTTGWLLSDPAAAQQWALQMPRGETRDLVIDTFFEQGMGSPLDIETLFKSYSSDQKADRSIANYVERVSRNRSSFGAEGISQAERLIELITDRELRAEVEEVFAEGG